jgi:hypothetical protein
MHRLMGHSPIVNKSALAHSGTPLNTDILDRDSGSVVSCSHIRPLTFVSSNSSRIIPGGSSGLSPHLGKLKTRLTSYQMVPHPTPLPAPTPMLNILLLPKTLIPEMTLQTLKSPFPLLLRSTAASANPWRTLSPRSPLLNRGIASRLRPYKLRPKLSPSRKSCDLYLFVLTVYIVIYWH